MRNVDGQCPARFTFRAIHFTFKPCPFLILVMRTGGTLGSSAGRHAMKFSGGPKFHNRCGTPFPTGFPKFSPRLLISSPPSLAGSEYAGPDLKPNEELYPTTSRLSLVTSLVSDDSQCTSSRRTTEQYLQFERHVQSWKRVHHQTVFQAMLEADRLGCIACLHRNSY